MASGASVSGSFKKTMTFLNHMKQGKPFEVLNHYGKVGVEALSSATPRDTGLTADSWYYRVGHKDGKYFISWHNSHEEAGVNIAIIIQYGHATGSGAYIQGIDYVNPAMRPVFDDIRENVWKQVTYG